MNEKMIEIKGQKVSESTIAEALKKHCNFQKNYQFQAGDVVKNEWDSWRIIVRTAGGLTSHNESGKQQSCNQKAFEERNYQKITTLSELIEYWEENHGNTPTF